MRNNVYILKGGMANQIIILANAFSQHQHGNNVYIDVKHSFSTDRYSRNPLFEFIEKLDIPVLNLNKFETFWIKILRKMTGNKKVQYILGRTTVIDSYFQTCSGLRAVIDHEFVERLNDYPL